MKRLWRRLVDYGAELRRRNVFGATAAYTSVAVVIALGVAQLYEVLLLPDWTPRLIIVLLVAGLPVVITLSWLRDARPELPPPSDELSVSAIGRQEPVPAPAPAPTRDDPPERRRHEVVEHERVITAEVCRKLDRKQLDARMVGDRLLYSDNHADSNVLVVYLHGFGGDHHGWSTVLEQSPYRGVAPTLYGFEKDRSTPRIALALTDHLTLLHYFVQEIVRENRPETIVLVGFSSGADMGFRLLGERPAAEPPLVDGFLALGANLSLATCFVSGALARESSSGEADLLAELRKAAKGSASLGEWLNVHEYLVMILRKFHPKLAPLRRHGQDIVQPFVQEEAVFTRWVREVSGRVTAMCCVFADTEMEAVPAQRLILDHLDSGVLGPHFREGYIVIEPGADHFDLKTVTTVNRYVADLVRTLTHA